MMGGRSPVLMSDTLALAILLEIERFPWYTPETRKFRS